MLISLATAQCALVILIACRITVVARDVDPIVIKGSKFFYKTNGTEFFIKGVAYQQDGYYASYTSGLPIIDPFSDGPTCARDIPYLQNASVNVVRAYAVDSTEDHSACMAELANAGIYVIMDLTGNQKDQKIDTASPAWNYLMYDQMTGVVDAFHNYTNVLGFFVGTEVINSTYTSSAPFVKAAARDIKGYIEEMKYRPIPVGYATDQQPETEDIAAYLNCGQDQADAIDFLGLNLYSWCGNSTLVESGYSDSIAAFKNYSIPIFLSEFGCNVISPRKFTEIQAIFGDEMSSVFSGGIVYQYFHDNEDYGLVDVYGDSVSTSADYSYFSKEMATVTASSIGYSVYDPTNVQQACPTTDSSWQAASTLPPKPYARLCQCMMSSLTCVSPTSANDTDLSNLFSAVCGSDVTACNGIVTNSSNGAYGAYSVCNSTELASWVLNEYFVGNGKETSACTSLGGSIQEPVAQAKTASDCVILMNQAGEDGTGTVTSTPRAPSAAATDDSSGGSSTGNSNPDGTTVAAVTDSGGGLGGGAIAGIVVGIAVVMAIIGMLSFFLWRARRKSRAAGAHGPDGYTHTKAELPADQRSVPEADGQAGMGGGGTEHYKQYTGPPGAAELQGSNTDPAELPAPHGLAEAGLASPIESDHGPG